MVRNRLYPTILLGKGLARPIRRFFPTNQATGNNILSVDAQRKGL